MDKKRVFLAFTFKPVTTITDRQKDLKRRLISFQIKWVKEQNFHITICFFGETTVEQTKILSEVLYQALEDSTIFPVAVTAPGIFKDRKEPRVLWMGIKASEKLIELKKNIDNAVATLGFHSDIKPFHPHLTLGRFVPHQQITQKLKDVLDDSKKMEPLIFQVSEIVLFESKNSPNGVRYFPLETYSLKPE